MFLDRILYLFEEFNSNKSAIKVLQNQIPKDHFYSQRNDAHLSDVIEDCLESISGDQNLISELDRIKFSLKHLLLEINIIASIKKKLQSDIDDILKENDKINNELRELMQTEYGNTKSFFTLELFSMNKLSYKGKPLLKVLEEEINPISHLIIDKNKNVMTINLGESTYDKNFYFDFISKSLDLDPNIKDMIKLTPLEISFDNELFLRNMTSIFT